MSSTSIVPTEESSTGSLPMRKRKDVEGPVAENPKPLKKGLMSKAREIRLEQNRKAARESRRRKKVMIEELQRSVIFFSRANGTLKQQNEEFTRLLMQAQAQVSVIETQHQQPNMTAAKSEVVVDNALKSNEKPETAIDQTKAETVAAQAIYESQGFPAAAARAAAQSMNATSTSSAQAAVSAPSTASNGQALSQMQPGATMQAMANFQQAAAAAMQAAVHGMQGSAAANVNSAPSVAPTPRTQQVFNDTIAAIAMQQAAAAAVTGQQFLNNPFMAPMLAWQHQAAIASATAPASGIQAPTPPTTSSSQISNSGRIQNP